MDKTSIVKEWFDFAKQDLGSAKYLSCRSVPPLENICFHCQQATEKVLKGYLICQNEKPPHTHDLKLLCQMCADKDENFDKISQACVNLSPYGVRARYPFEIEILERDMQEALIDAEYVMSFTFQKTRDRDRKISDVLSEETKEIDYKQMFEWLENSVVQNDKNEQRTLDDFVAVSKKNASTPVQERNTLERDWGAREWD